MGPDQEAEHDISINPPAAPTRFSLTTPVSQDAIYTITVLLHVKTCEAHLLFNLEEEDLKI